MLFCMQLLESARWLDTCCQVTLGIKLVLSNDQTTNYDPVRKLKCDSIGDIMCSVFVELVVL